MPGAQPRRSPLARVSATARRGANVPAGVPGVYRVSRSPVRTVQADAGLPGRVSSNPWIQGPDVESGQGLLRYAWLSQDDDSTADVLAGTSAAQTTYGGGSVGALCSSNTPTTEFYALVIYLPMMALNMPPEFPDEDDWPVGATDVEAETAQGTLLSGNYTGSLVEWEGVPTSSGKLLHIPPDLFDPGHWTTATTHLRWLTPAELNDGDVTVIAEVDTATSPVAVDFDMSTTYDSGTGLGVLAMVTDQHYDAATWSGFDAEIRLGLTSWLFTYRPPRYRFVF